MSAPVALAVLVAALFHASWNAIVRMRGHRIVLMALITLLGALVVLPTLLVLPLPLSAAWPWIVTSMVLHLGYNTLLALAYTHGDLSGVYPLARGAATLLTLVAGMAIGETVTGLEVAGIIILAAGVLVLALDRGWSALRDNRQSVVYALLTACFIAGYTISDGTGARLAGNPHSYAAWLFVLDGIPLTVFVLARQPEKFREVAATNWRSGLVASVLSVAAYWIVIWAMTKAPIPLVAALRETSVIFAVLVGALLLGERMTPARIAAPLVMLAGLALIRLG